MFPDSFARRYVSTHSRPKAAGLRIFRQENDIKSFNTQPPEGGWFLSKQSLIKGRDGFNTQPPEGGWQAYAHAPQQTILFQHTAARRRLGPVLSSRGFFIGVSTHSRPKAAGAFLKSLAPSGFAAPISLSSREKREREYNTAFSVTPAFAIS